MPSLLAIRNPLTDAKDTLSSWDKCMAKNYCKWPVIVAIIIGSLIILSVVLCVARCVCCGAECACCCFKCCAGCCGSGRKGHKRMNSAGPPPVYPPSGYNGIPPAPPVDQQYRSHAAPAAVPTYRGVEPERPQFATFDVSSNKPVNDDALPAMPSWSEAKSTHVEELVVPEKKGDMEMDRLDHNGSATGGLVAAAAVPGGMAMGGRRSPGRSPLHQSPPHDDYGFPQGYQNDSFVSAVPHRNSPGPQGGPHRGPQDAYRGGSPQNLSPVYGAGAGPGFNNNQQYGRRSPNRSPVQHQGYNNSFERGYGQDQYNNRPPPQRSPVHADSYESSFNTRNDYYQADRRPSPPANHSDYARVPAQEPTPVRSHAPGYATTSPTTYDAPAPSSTPAPSYPGQQTYQPEGATYPGQPAYRAFSPAQNDQYSGVQRKAVDGSWKEV